MPDPPPPLTPLAAAVLHVGAPERILALDCADGDAALFLAREFPLARVRGVDRSEDAVRRATGRVGLDPEGRVAFKRAAPRSLPFPDDHFDLVTAMDAAASPGEVERVLRPGGFLAIARSRGDEALRGPGGALLRWRLARRGIEPIWSEAAGEGSFSVFRLARPGPPSASQ